MNNPGYYTAKDIERYHNGGMTAAEMHALEKAALDDPMLADALEGYRFSKAPAMERASLKTRLQQRIEDGKRENRSVWLQPWLRIAALFILIAGAGWLVMQTFSTRENDLATNSPALNKEVGLPESVAADSAAIVSEQSPAAPAIDSNTSDIASLNGEKKGRTNPAVQAETSAPLTAMKDAPAVENKVAATKAEEADAALAPPQNEVAAVPTVAPPSVLRQEMDSNLNNSVAKQKRANLPQKATASGSRAGLFSTDSLGQPVTGWAAFEEYIAQNRKSYLPLNKKQSTEKSVELAFDINQAGRPVNIVVTKPLTNENNAEAIRLLQVGPKWKGKSGRVKIHFP